MNDKITDREKQRLVHQKIGYVYVSHSNTIPTGRRFGQCSAVPECEVQTG
ncbi:hypothetical protein [Lactiplantibacillus paraplantarum]|nr:hypothetical protein [Lactiplantibacillus paraplantarum]